MSKTLSMDHHRPKRVDSAINTLRGHERDGFISRTVYLTKPPSVEYALTELGQELLGPVEALGTWVIDNVQRIEGAWELYDTRA